MNSICRVGSPIHQSVGVNQVPRRILLEELHLGRKVIGEPGIIGVEKREKFAASPPDCRVSAPAQRLFSWRM